MPWARMHAENLSACALSCCSWAGVGPLPPFGSRFLQALCAAWNRELLTPSCSRATLGIDPLLLGSGKLDTPWERMQREKASASACCTDAAEELERAVLVVIVVEPS